ncbi:MAG TPA: DUF4177 domain-containing protein [Blastocatellia bacterium]|nr:DUF4177 domain-containing protein [Blastocatellia bacterium]HMX25574.1 DUF4177 domain-containing protein [Blastocatellia bacterium]HMY72787.1 DUF4177 domain-containing protein [Blastocatellia bacterium]HMZ20342.1 DUF4177 domain-containing protein [Blastocatellia bacterium]HNG32850.1 DUF4177 domain-containing protein [Blastocatellia bacterium]
MMQLWEYLTLTVRDGIVKSANGEMLAKESFWGTIKGQAFPNFLNELGKLGWEVVGVSSILNAAQLPVTVEMVVILKRPLLSPNK